MVSRVQDWTKGTKQVVMPAMTRARLWISKQSAHGRSDIHPLMIRPAVLEIPSSYTEIFSMNLNFRDQLIFHMEFQIDIGHSLKNWHSYLKEDILYLLIMKKTCDFGSLWEISKIENKQKFFIWQCFQLISAVYYLNQYLCPSGD